MRNYCIKCGASIDGLFVQGSPDDSYCKRCYGQEFPFGVMTLPMSHCSVTCVEQRRD